MKQKDFLVWMLGYPVVCSICDFVDLYLLEKTYTAEVIGITALITIILYITIGCLLWNKENNNEQK